MSPHFSASHTTGVTASHHCPFRSHISEVPWGLGSALIQAVSSGRIVTAVVDTVPSFTTQSILQLPPEGAHKVLLMLVPCSLLRYIWISVQRWGPLALASAAHLPVLCCSNISLWLCSGNKPCPFLSVPSPPDLLLLSQDGSSPHPLPMSLSFPPHVSSCQGFSRWTLTAGKGSPNTSIPVLTSGIELEIL